MRLSDAVSFTATSAGTGDFVYGTARASFLTPAQAVTNGELADGDLVPYLAQDSLTSPTQREWGHATFTAATNTFARTTVLGSVSAGTNSTSACSFSTAPVVSLTALAEDLLCYTATVPTNNTSAGVPFQFTFDGSGNLYICYATNTWAKYTNVAPFSSQSEPVPIIFG